MKRMFFFVSLLLVITLFNFKNSYSQPSAENQTYQDFLNSLKKLELDGSRIYPVSSMFIARDAGEIYIDSGYVILSKPVLGRTVGAVFVGACNFQFNPPLNIEQNQLEHYFGSRNLSIPIKEFAFFDADSIFYEIQRNYQPVQFTIPISANSLWSKSLNLISDAKSEQIMSILGNFIWENNYDQSLVAILAPETGSEMVFTFAPDDEEEISLYKYFADKDDKINADLVCRFSLSEYYKSPNIDSLIEAKRRLKIEKYVLKCSIDNNLYTKFNSEIKIKVNCPQIQWLRFVLHNDFSIKKTVDEKNNNLSFYNDDAKGKRWVKLAKPLKKGDSLTIIMDYEGKSLIKEDDYTYFKSSTGWYPKFGEREKSYFDINIQYPNTYKLVCVGDLVKTEEKDASIIKTYKTSYPIKNAGFNIGNFLVEELKNDSITPKTLFYNNDDMEETVITTLDLSTSFFGELFDSLDIKHFHAVETPDYQNSVFPNLINISYKEFDNFEKEKNVKKYIAYEVARQWFGNNIEYKTYRDKWVCEGLAEYMAMLYIGKIFNTEYVYVNCLINYKYELGELYKKNDDDGIYSSPISLYYRNNITNKDSYSSSPVIKKGAWIFHMLRYMMIDLQKDLSEKNFYTLLKTIFTKYKGKGFSTDDLRTEVENIVKFDMKWFFEQWVDRNDIPIYIIAITTEKQANEYYKVKLRVKQTNVPDNFQMILPIDIIMGDKGHRYGRFKISGNTKNYELNYDAPYEPDAIVFSPFFSVLCNFKKLSWD